MSEIFLAPYLEAELYSRCACDVARTPNDGVKRISLIAKMPKSHFQSDTRVCEYAKLWIELHALQSTRLDVARIDCRCPDAPGWKLIRYVYPSSVFVQPHRTHDDPSDRIDC